MDGLSEKPPVEKVHIYIGSRWGFRTWRCFGTHIGVGRFGSGTKQVIHAGMHDLMISKTEGGTE